MLVAAVAANYLGADYFKRTHLEEANPLLGAAVGGHDGQPAPAEGGDASQSPREAPGSSQTPSPAPAIDSGPVVLAEGTFRDGEPGHRGSGKASLGRDAAGNAVLVLSDFSVTNGPNLHVILGTTTGGGGEGLDLGKLKATDGSFSYEVPAGSDLASFRSVTIWCASFPTIFAVATLGA